MTFNTELFDSILAAPLDSNQLPGAQGPAVVSRNLIYQEIASKGNLSSYSMDSLFHSCPRKFAIKKLQAATNSPEERSGNATFAFGHAVGAGIATYDVAQDMRAAIWSAFLAWDVDLLQVETNKSGKLTGKSFHEAVWALYLYKTFVEEETDLHEYDSVKIEAVLAVDFEDGHYYVGHIDEVLQHKVTGEYLVKENKTTGMTVVDPCLYSNSDQALSYAVVVDMLGGSSYSVLYTIYSSAAQKWIQYSFVKSGHKKAEWIQDQLLMHQHRDDFSSANFWPKRGASCFNYMRRCESYDVCDLSLGNMFGMEFGDLPRIESLEELGMIEPIDYATTLSALVARQQAKLSEF